MNHPFLHPVDPGTCRPPVCYDQLNTWIEELPREFAARNTPPPKATLLCGIPGSGKGLVVRAIAQGLNRPLHRLDPACDPFALAEIATLLGVDKPSVLWIDQPGDAHLGIVHWLLDRESQPVFLVATTDRPYRLPMGFVRADVFDSIWHLDLPNPQQRSAVWDQVIVTPDPSPGRYDSTLLARDTALFTPGEIHAAYQRTMRIKAGKLPTERELALQSADIHPIAQDLDEQLSRLREWSARHARSAAKTWHDD